MLIVESGGASVPVSHSRRKAERRHLACFQSLNRVLHKRSERPLEPLIQWRRKALLGTLKEFRRQAFPERASRQNFCRAGGGVVPLMDGQPQTPCRQLMIQKWFSQFQP